MSSAKLPLSSPFAIEHFGRGKAEGRAEGKAEGQTEGEANALLMVLYARGLQLADEDKARITSCADIDQLRTWVVRAANATTIADVFGR